MGRGGVRAAGREVEDGAKANAVMRDWSGG